MVREDEEKEIRTVLRGEKDDLEFSIASREENAPDGWQVHATGKICLASSDSPRHHHPKIFEATCTERQLDLTHKADTSARLIEFGPRWNAVRRVSTAKEQALAFLELPEEYADDLALYALHPALLDCATGFALFLGTSEKGESSCGSPTGICESAGP